MSLFFILLFHSTFYPSILSISCIILLTPYKRFICSKILPILIKWYYSLCICICYSKSLKFSHLFLKILSWFISFNLLTFYFFKYFSIYLKESSFLISKVCITFSWEKWENIKTKTILLNIIFWHLIFIEKNFLSVIIIKSSLIWIWYHIICLLNL